MPGFVRRFAGFTYSSQTGLERDGVQIRLGPQARQLLELLLESEGGIVSKSDIATRLWPDRPPTDDSIDRCAYLLRKPLREAGAGDLIATAYGRGLSLRAKVEVVNAAAAPARQAAAPLSARVQDHWQTTYELAGPRTREGLERAQAATAAAAEIDPDSPAVWSLSATVAAWRSIRGHLAPAQAAEMIERSAGRALDIAPGYTPALAVLGWARATLLRRNAEGIEMLDQSIEQDPHYGKARTFRAWALTEQARLPEALDDTDAGLRNAPLDQGLLTLHAWLLLCAGEIDGASAFARHALDARPDGAGLRGVISTAASLLGRHEEAVEAARRSVEQIPDDPLLEMGLAYALARAGQNEEAENILARFDVKARASRPCLAAAAAFVALGRPEAALEALKHGMNSGCPSFAFAACDPRLASLSEPIARLRGAPARQPHSG